jgi:hypothetical protein
MDNEANGVVIRPATDADVPALVALEKGVYGALGTDCYGETHFRAWLRVHPEGLVLAEAGGTVVGYQYSQFVEFSLDDVASLPSYDEFTDHGLTVTTHVPTGNSVHGVTICSVHPGAGCMLVESIFDLMRRRGKRYTIGFSRIAGFDAYMRGLEAAGLWPLPGVEERTVALWYALETARMVGGSVLPSLTPGPDLPFPPPSRPDPVIGRQLRFKEFRVAGILPGCMRDPQSRDHAVLIVRENETLIEP